MSKPTIDDVISKVERDKKLNFDDMSVALDNVIEHLKRADATIKRQQEALDAVRKLQRYKNVACIERDGSIVQWSVEQQDGPVVMSDDLDEALEAYNDYLQNTERPMSINDQKWQDKLKAALSKASPSDTQAEVSDE